jgi:16S rRNA G966 N2-methylase RsmD
MMRTIELGYVDMVDPTWPPLVEMESFLAADDEVKGEDGDEHEDAEVGDNSSNDANGVGSHRHNRFGSGAEPRRAAAGLQVEVAADPAVEEAKLMFSAHSRELLAYDGHKASVVVMCMTWQEYYDKSQSARAGADKVKLPVAQFIHVDPWYDATTLDADDAEKFRKLIDKSSVVGTRILVWGTFGGLHRWQEMLQGVYNPNATTKWEVEPTPIVVVRHASRNRQAHRGRTLRRNCEFAILATRVPKATNPRQRRNLDGANHTDQLVALALPALPHLPKLSDNSNVILEYKPPTKKERLKDSKGTALRKLAEKAVSLTAQILSRWTAPDDTVLDLFSGSSGMAVALIALGRGRKYVGVDNDPDIMDAVHARIGRAHLLRAQQQNEMNTSLARLVSFQSLASAHHSFLLPAHNIPVTMLNGKELAVGSPHNNLDWVQPETASRFEIRETQMSANGLQMGEGLFLRGDVASIEVGTEVPELYFFGAFVESSQLETIYPDGVPGYPGVFSLRAPVAEYSLVLDERCPAAKINDARGSPRAYT